MENWNRDYDSWYKSSIFTASEVNFSPHFRWEQVHGPDDPDPAVAPSLREDNDRRYWANIFTLDHSAYVFVLEVRFVRRSCVTYLP